MINGPIACASKMITRVLSSVAEAELCGGFKIAQDAVWYRRILHDLGYPQPPTLLRMDNTVAIGLALGTINVVHHLQSNFHLGMGLGQTMETLIHARSSTPTSEIRPNPKFHLHIFPFDSVGISTSLLRH